MSPGAADAWGCAGHDARAHEAGRHEALLLHYCQVFAGRDPKTGKKRYLTGTASSEREAHRVIHRLVKELEAGHVPRDKATLNELIDAWLEAAGPSGENTRAVYLGYINKHIKDEIGRMAASKLRVEDLDRWYARLSGEGLAPASIRELHNIVRGALTQGVRWGWVGANVAVMASPPSVPKPVISTPDPSVVRKLIDEALSSDPEFAVYVRLAAVTGARPGEMCALRWSDLHAETSDLDIQRRVIRVPPQTMVKDLTKTGKTRRVPLDARTVEMLLEHRESMEERAAVAGLSLVRDAYMFTDALDGSEWWRPDSTSRRFRSLCGRCGCAGVPLYGLRHQAATTMIDIGVDAKTVSERLGNSVATVLGTYTRARSAADRAAGDLLASALDGLAPST